MCHAGAVREKCVLQSRLCTEPVYCNVFVNRHHGDTVPDPASCLAFPAVYLFLPVFIEPGGLALLSSIGIIIRMRQENHSILLKPGFV